VFDAKSEELRSGIRPMKKLIAFEIVEESANISNT
jgi:hypothetical protein